MKDVNVVSYYFTHGTNRCFPRQIELEGNRLSFLENGVRCLIQKGQGIIQIFNMTDGNKLYRLSFEPGSRTWKLLNTRSL